MVLEASASVEKETEEQAIRTGDEPVLEVVKEKTGAEPVWMEVEEVRTGDEPVREAEELRTGEKPVPADVELGTGDIPQKHQQRPKNHLFWRANRRLQRPALSKHPLLGLF